MAGSVRGTPRFAPHSAPADPRDPREIERDKNRKLLHDLNRRHGELQRRCDAEREEARQLQGRLRQDAEAALRQAESSRIDVARLRSDLQGQRGTAQQEQAGLRQELAALGQSVASGADAAKAVRGELGALAGELQQARGALWQEQGRLKAEVDAMARARAELQGELGQMKREVQVGVQQELTSLRQALASGADLAKVRTKLSAVASELQQMRDALQQEQGRLEEVEAGAVARAKAEVQGELGQIRREVQATMALVQGTKRVESEHHRSLQEQQSQIQRLRESAQSRNELIALRAQGDLLGLEFRHLVRKLQERGVFAPIREEPLQEEECPPVGTIELGEDCFTARLLLRLGFLQAKNWAEQSSDEETAGGRREGLREGKAAHYENVSGLQEPEIVEGGPGYFEVTSFWLLICFLTLCMQLLVISMMLRNGMDAGDECLAAPPKRNEWWLLHVSKAAAILLAGIMLAKDLLDIMNYWMVSELLEPRRNWEVVLSAAMRCALTFLVAVAHVVIYTYMSSPASVWINMTALTFINELGQAVFEVAKRGVFGHHISKTMTTLNFQLTFVSEYPHWFSWVRNVTLAVSFGSIVLLAGVAFFSADNLCPHLEEAAAAAGRALDSAAPVSS